MAWCFCIYESPKYLLIKIEELEKRTGPKEEIDRLTD
jgi:hypothetical protein